MNDFLSQQNKIKIIVFPNHLILLFLFYNLSPTFELHHTPARAASLATRSSPAHAHPAASPGINSASQDKTLIASTPRLRCNRMKDPNPYKIALLVGVK